MILIFSCVFYSVNSTNLKTFPYVYILVFGCKSSFYFLLTQSDPKQEKENFGQEDKKKKK